MKTTPWFLLMIALLANVARGQVAAPTVTSMPSLTFMGPLSPEGAALEAVRISVNGQIHRVVAGSTLEIVKGDRVTVMDASLHNPSGTIEAVNFQGFPGRGDKKADDRGLTARSERDLLSRWMLKDAPKETYAVIASSFGIEHGRVFLHIAPAELKAIVVNVNGAKVRVEPAKGFQVKATDKIRIESVETSVPANRDVTFRMSGPSSTDGTMVMSVLYRGIVFGKTTVRVVR